MFIEVQNTSPALKNVWLRACIAVERFFLSVSIMQKTTFVLLLFFYSDETICSVSFCSWLPITCAGFVIDYWTSQITHLKLSYFFYYFPFTSSLCIWKQFLNDFVLQYRIYQNLDHKFTLISNLNPVTLKKILHPLINFRNVFLADKQHILGNF